MQGDSQTDRPERMDDVEFETKLLEMNWYVQKAFDLLSFDSTHLADECNDLLDEPGDLIPTVDDLLKEHFEELHQSFLLNKFDDPQFEWEIVRRTGGTGNDIFECPYRDEHIFGSSAHFLGLNYYIIVEDEIHSALISRGSSLATALIPEFEAFVDALFQPLDRIRAMMERERLLLISWQPRTDTPADSRKRFQKRSRRRFDAKGAACAEAFKRARATDPTLDLKRFVEDYAAENDLPSPQGIYRRLTDNRDIWDPNGEYK